MNISVIISVYKDYESLSVVLESLNLQTYKDKFEVIIAEDCEEIEMIKFLDNCKKKYSFELKHVSQKDDGFRKNKILNKAIRISKGDYLIFVDGDCMLHKDFILEYSKKFTKNSLLIGRRVMLCDNLTQKIKSNFFIPSILQILTSKSRHKEEGIKLPYLFNNKKIKGMLGCNFGLDRNLMIKINGFNEDYVFAGTGEDDDVYIRLKRIEQIKIISIRNRAIQYHLNHFRSYLDQKSNNHILLEKTINSSEYICKNGLEKLN